MPAVITTEQQEIHQDRIVGSLEGARESVVLTLCESL